MKIKIILALLFLFPTFAFSATPSKCPPVSLMQSAKIQRAFATNDTKIKWMVVMRREYFDLAGWAFAIFDLPVTDEIAAGQEAMVALTTMAYMEGPTKNENLWNCKYLNNQGIRAVAITNGELY